jgi:hypothetical protein
VTRVITTGTMKQLGQHLLEPFLRLSVAEQERLRKALYEQATGKPYRPEQSAGRRAPEENKS